MATLKTYGFYSDVLSSDSVAQIMLPPGKIKTYIVARESSLPDGSTSKLERSNASSNNLRHIYDAIYERLITASVTTFTSTRGLGLERMVLVVKVSSPIDYGISATIGGALIKLSGLLPALTAYPVSGLHWFTTSTTTL